MFFSLQNFQVVFPLVLLTTLVSTPAHTEGTNDRHTVVPESESFGDLNLRLSHRPLAPPKDMIVTKIPLHQLSVAKSMVAPSPRAVILEDDQRRRIAVLSEDAVGRLTLFLLEQVPLNPALPGLVQCANSRGCQTDRTPLTGGLSCLALCVKDILESAVLNPSAS